MLRAGMVRQASAGDLFLAALRLQGCCATSSGSSTRSKQRAGHIPMLMPTLQSAELWLGKWGAFTTPNGPDDAAHPATAHDRDMLYGPTNGGNCIHGTSSAADVTSLPGDLPLTALPHPCWNSATEIRPRYGP